MFLLGYLASEITPPPPYGTLSSTIINKYYSHWFIYLWMMKRVSQGKSKGTGSYKLYVRVVIIYPHNKLCAYETSHHLEPSGSNETHALPWSGCHQKHRHTGHYWCHTLQNGGHENHDKSLGGWSPRLTPDTRNNYESWPHSQMTAETSAETTRWQVSGAKANSSNCLFFK